MITKMGRLHLGMKMLSDLGSLEETAKIMSFAHKPKNSSIWKICYVTGCPLPISWLVGTFEFQNWILRSFGLYSGFFWRKSTSIVACSVLIPSFDSKPPKCGVFLLPQIQPTYIQLLGNVIFAHCVTSHPFCSHGECTSTLPCTICFQDISWSM